MLSHVLFRQFSTKSAIKDVMVVGAGMMGSGIAQVAAVAGMNVFLADQPPDNLVRARKNIERSLRLLADKQFADDKHGREESRNYVEETLNRIKDASDPSQPAGQADLIIEAVIENMAVKKELFEKLDKVAANHTIFASNTSSLSVTEMSTVTQRQDRFGGLHFFSPVPIMKLVEVIRIDNTSEHTFDSLMEFVRKIGKQPVACKDTPGFIVNRLLIPYMLEAARMVDRGDAQPEDVDLGMKLGAGYKIGPLELLDFIGLDLAKMIVEGWHKEKPEDPLFKPVDIIDKLVEQGRLGRKSGQGFYGYESSSSDDNKRPRSSS